MVHGAVHHQAEALLRLPQFPFAGATLGNVLNLGDEVQRPAQAVAHDCTIELSKDDGTILVDVALLHSVAFGPAVEQIPGMRKIGFQVVRMREFLKSQAQQLGFAEAEHGAERLVDADEAAIERHHRESDRRLVDGQSNALFDFRQLSFLGREPIDGLAQLDPQVPACLDGLKAIGDQVRANGDAADDALFVTPRADRPMNPVEAAVGMHQTIAEAFFRGARQAIAVGLPPAVRNLGKHVVVAAADQFRVVRQPVFPLPATVDGQIAHVAIKNGHSAQGVSDQVEPKLSSAHGGRAGQ
ncbi:MAG: hypothetical protein NTZ11_16770 [Gammaproteobacteria bacterium]|nr:hypothetical protein [Gammaproteobacteria bacterium]